MRASYGARAHHLLAVLWGLTLIGGLLESPAVAQPPMFLEPTSSSAAQHTAAPQVSGGATALQEPATSSESHEPLEDQIFEVLVVVFIVVPILAIVLGLLLVIPVVLLAVSLVLDGGCLRYLLFVLGWFFAIIYGLIVGTVVEELLFGIEFLSKSIFYVFMWGYPVAALWGHRTLQALPREQYRAWDQTLTGGALLGFGAGSVAGLLRSAGSGFGGFGGGSFGGGGASGSWSGASGAAGGASAIGTGGSSQAAAVAASTATGRTSKETSSTSSSEASAPQSYWARLRRWFQKFQWYHILAFVLVTLVFVPLGLGAMQALQNATVSAFVLVSVIAYSGYRLLRRNPGATQSVFRSVSSFKGGEGSSSWS